jgi:methionine-gamma-lyase
MTSQQHGHEGLGIASLAIHAGEEPDPVYGAVAAPIYQTSTFAFDSPEQGASRFAGKESGYIYTRLGNPTIDRLHEKISALEGGVGALATASGMAAVSTLYFSYLSSGDHIVGTSSLYGPSRIIMEKEFYRFGVSSSWVDTGDLDQVNAALRPETKMVYVETPSNPTMRLTDLVAVSEICKERGILLAVDNTFATPVLQRPLDIGADISLHSVTKFINGHADVVGGLLVFKDKEVMKRAIKPWQMLGGTMDPHQAWLVLRGAKTLKMRVECAQKNAMKVAQMLEEHPKVDWILYPGLETHPQYELAQRQMAGPGALISFGVLGGLEAGKKVLQAVKLCTLAVSLGGIETLIQHPASMTHAGMGSEALAQAEIGEGLIRLSVGCEDCNDLLADLDQALRAS